MAAEWDLKVLGCLKDGHQSPDIHSCIGRINGNGDQLGRRCRNPLAAHSEATAKDIWRAMPAMFKNTADQEDVLEQVATLLLCRGVHQKQVDQVDRVIKRWTAVLTKHSELMVSKTKSKQRHEQSPRYQRADSAISIGNHYTPISGSEATESDDDSVVSTMSTRRLANKMENTSAKLSAGKTHSTTTDSLRVQERKQHSLLVQSSQAVDGPEEVKRLKDRVRASDEALLAEKAQHEATKQARLHDQELRRKQADYERQVLKAAEIQRQKEYEQQALKAAEMQRQADYQRQIQEEVDTRRQADELAELKRVVCEQRKELDHHLQRRGQADREAEAQLEEQAQLLDDEDDLSPTSPCSPIDRQLARKRWGRIDNIRTLTSTFSTAPWAFMPSKLQVINISFADVMHYLRVASPDDQRAVERYAKVQRVESERRALAKHLPFVATVPALARPAVAATRVWRRIKSNS